MCKALMQSRTEVLLEAATVYCIAINDGHKADQWCSNTVVEIKSYHKW